MCIDNKRRKKRNIKRGGGEECGLQVAGRGNKLSKAFLPFVKSHLGLSDPAPDLRGPFVGGMGGQTLHLSKMNLRRD